MQLHHVSVSVPPGRFDTLRRFYADGLGLMELPPPAEWRERLLWYRLGTCELHLIVDDNWQLPHQNTITPGGTPHIALIVADLDAVVDRLRRHGAPIETIDV